MLTIAFITPTVYMQKAFSTCTCIIINSNFNYLPICVHYGACMIICTATLEAGFFPPCIAEQLVPGTVMWVPGNFPTFVVVLHITLSLPRDF